MFTNNYDALVKIQAINNNQNHYYGIPMVAYDGNTRYIGRPQTGYFEYNNVYISAMSYSSGVHFGSGSTSPTKSDYSLESPITSGLRSSQQNSNGKDENGKLFVRYVYTLTNTGSSNIVVSEIGYFHQVVGGASQGTSGGNYYGMLMLREVFSPVTIPPGESAAITLTVKLDEVVVTT